MEYDELSLRLAEYADLSEQELWERAYYWYYGPEADPMLFESDFGNYFEAVDQSKEVPEYVKHFIHTLKVEL